MAANDLLPFISLRFNILIGNSSAFKLQSGLLSLVLFVSIFESKLFQKTYWFRDLLQLNKQLTSNCYYFPDHDNMMHWKMLHKFDSRINYFSIEKDPFPIFKLYDQHPDQHAFIPGWLIVNRSFTILPRQTLIKIDSLQIIEPDVTVKRVGDVEAIFMENRLRLLEYENVLNSSSSKSEMK